jgi:hypothetical protein
MQVADRSRPHTSKPTSRPMSATLAVPEKTPLHPPPLPHSPQSSSATVPTLPLPAGSTCTLFLLAAWGADTARRTPTAPRGLKTTMGSPPAPQLYPGPRSTAPSGSHAPQHAVIGRRWFAGQGFPAEGSSCAPECPVLFPTQGLKSQAPCSLPQCSTINNYK